MGSRRPYSQQYLDEKDPSEVSLLPQAPEHEPGCNNKRILKFDDKGYIIYLYMKYTPICSKLLIVTKENKNQLKKNYDARDEKTKNNEALTKKPFLAFALNIKQKN